MAATVHTPKFGQRRRPGAWIFAVHFVDGSVRTMAKIGRSQADAVLMLLDELESGPEVERVDCAPLPRAQVEELLELTAASVVLPLPGRALHGGAA